MNMEKIFSIFFMLLYFFEVDIFYILYSSVHGYQGYFVICTHILKYNQYTITLTWLHIAFIFILKTVNTISSQQRLCNAVPLRNME